MAPVPSCVPSQWLLSNSGVPCPSLEPCPTLVSPVYPRSSCPALHISFQCPMSHLVSLLVTSWLLCLLLSHPSSSHPGAPHPFLIPSVPSWWLLSHPDALVAHPSTSCLLSEPYPTHMNVSHPMSPVVPSVPSHVPSCYLVPHPDASCPISVTGVPSWLLMSHPDTS